MSWSDLIGRYQKSYAPTVQPGHNLGLLTSNPEALAAADQQYPGTGGYKAPPAPEMKDMPAPVGHPAVMPEVAEINAQPFVSGYGPPAGSGMTQQAPTNLSLDKQAVDPVMQPAVMPGGQQLDMNYRLAQQLGQQTNFQSPGNAYGQQMAQQLGQQLPEGERLSSPAVEPTGGYSFQTRMQGYQPPGNAYGKMGGFPQGRFSQQHQAIMPSTIQGLGRLDAAPTAPPGFDQNAINADPEGFARDVAAAPEGSWLSRGMSQQQQAGPPPGYDAGSNPGYHGPGMGQMGGAAHGPWSNQPQPPQFGGMGGKGGGTGFGYRRPQPQPSYGGMGGKGGGMQQPRQQPAFGGGMGGKGGGGGGYGAFGGGG